MNLSIPIEPDGYFRANPRGIHMTDDDVRTALCFDVADNLADALAHATKAGTLFPIMTAMYEMANWLLVVGAEGSC